MGSQMSSDNASNKENGKKRCVVIMYDTLCRHFMPSYGNEWIKAPNFERLAKKTTQFQNFLCGLDALHASSKGNAHRKIQLLAPILGPVEALRRFDASNL